MTTPTPMFGHDRIASPAGRLESRPHHAAFPRANFPRAGFTLVEVLLAAAVSSLVLGVLVLLLITTAGAAQTPASPGTQAIHATHGLDELAADLARTTALIRISGTELELLLPDLSGDGEADRAHYTWSGTPGDPLLRRYSSSVRAAYGPPRILAASVHELLFVPDVVNATTALTSTPVRESVLAEHLAPTGTLLDRITPARAFSQAFTPIVPAATTSFTLSRIQLRLQQTTLTSGSLRVSLTPASGGVPAGSPILSRVVPADALPRSLDWVDFHFPGSPSLPANASYAVTLLASGSAEPAAVQWVPSGAASAQRASLSHDGGATWTSTTGALLFRVHGHLTPDAPPALRVAGNRRLAGITVHLTPSAPGSRLISQHFATLNRPEAP